jgi:putative methionine-R-sulfoxide reductase with GAF domain
MKVKIYKIAAIVFLILFALVGIFLGNYVLGLSRTIVDTAGKMGFSAQLSQLMYRLLIFIIIEIIIGFLAILLTFIASKKDEVNVVYVEKDQQQINNEVENKEQNNENNAEKQEELIKRVRKALQEEKDITDEKMLSIICKATDACQGMFYVRKEDNGVYFAATASYAFFTEEDLHKHYELGEGLVGQAAKEKILLHIEQVPQNYVTIVSGLGKSKPISLIIAPVVKDNQTIAVIELAFFKEITDFDKETIAAIVKTK